MKVVFDNFIRIYKSKQATLDEIREELTFKNPAYGIAEAKRRRGQYVDEIPPRNIKCYHDHQDHLEIPVGVGLKFIKTIAKEHKELVQVVDIRSEGYGIDFKMPHRGFFKGFEPHQDKIIAKAVANHNCVISSPTGSGKCHGIDTPILMYNGQVKMVQDIVVGDQLMGPDSKPRNVLSLARGQEEMFEVIPTKGESFTCNRSHVLSLRSTSSEGKKYKKDAITNISIDDYLKESNTFKHRMKTWRTGVKFKSKKTLLDPYFLGLWLGDDSTRHNVIFNQDDVILNYLKMFDVTIKWDKTTFKTQIRGVSTGLNEARVYDSNETPIGKRIPTSYLMNSEKARLKVLAGLLDTDGHLQRNVYDITTKFNGLRDDILFLCRSLGLAAYSTVKMVKLEGWDKARPYNSITISGNLDKIPCKVKRKIASKRRQVKNVLNTGFKLESQGIGDYYGFTIDGDNLYLLGDFTVTHNTISALGIIEQLKMSTLIIVDSTDLFNQWVEELEALPEGDFSIGFYGNGKKKWGDVTVCTVQTIKRFNQKKRDEIKKKFGLLLIDEVHKAAAPTFVTATTIFNAKYKIGLSATPYRKDRKEFIFKSYIGPIALEISDQEVEDTGRITPMKYEFVDTGFSFDYDEINCEIELYPQICLADYERTLLVIEAVKADLKMGFVPLVVSNRTAHLDNIHRLLKKEGIQSGLIHGKVPKNARTAIRKAMTNGELDVLVANEKIFGTGMNVPILSSVHVTFYTSNKGLLKQIAGRVRRGYGDKEYGKMVYYRDDVFTLEKDNKTKDLFKKPVDSFSITYKKVENMFKRWGFTREEEKVIFNNITNDSDLLF